MSKSVKGQIEPTDGAITEVLVRASTLSAGAKAEGAAEDHVYARALFDTGSEITLIQTGLPGKLGIYSHDKRSLTGVHDHEEDCNIFDVDLEFPSSDIVIPNVSVAEASFEALTKTKIDVLIGRSVLKKGVLHYDGWNGTFSFTLEQ